jgi:hypothetical protein
MEYNVERVDGQDNPDTTYIVIDSDKPYAGKIVDIIKKEENIKYRQIRDFMGCAKDGRQICEDDKPKDNGITLHRLKTLPGFYKDIVEGDKTFEIRRNDRGFKVGDFLYLQEYNSVRGYTGRACICEVGYILDSKEYLPEGYVCMAIKKVF